MRPIHEEYVERVLSYQQIAAGMLTGHLTMRITQAGWAVDIEVQRSKNTGLVNSYLIHTFKVVPTEEEIGEAVPQWDFVEAVKFAEQKLDTLVASNPLDPFGNPRKVKHSIVKPMAA